MESVEAATNDPLLKVAYADPGEAAASFQRVRTCALPFDEVVERLRKGIEGAGLWVLAEIDPQALLRRGGYAIGATRQLLFFHPDFLARVLATDHAAAIEAPLKLVILEPPGGAVAVRWPDPAPAFARYGSPVLVDLGRELAAICDGIVATSLGPDAAAA